MECEHKNTEWIPAEPDINVGEDVLCDDCGKSVRGKTPQWAIEQDLVYICDLCCRTREDIDYA